MSCFLDKITKYFCIGRNRDDNTFQILEFKITLLEENRTFEELHVAIQIAFGWTNSHMHVFEVNGDSIGISGFEDFKKVMGDRNNPEFKEMKTWYGGMYDEDLFFKRTNQ